MVRKTVAKTLEDKLDVEAIRLNDSQGNAHSNSTADFLGRDRSLVGKPLIPMQKLTQDSRISWAVSALMGGAYRDVLFGFKTLRDGHENGHIECLLRMACVLVCCRSTAF